MLHIEVFAGASRKDIYRQLFLDTCLMIGLAFICSFLLMNDLLPFFNRLMDVELTMEYILSYQVLPWLLLGGFVLAVVPACFISRKLQSLTESEYRWFYQGKVRRLLVSGFQGGQFVVTLVLFSVFLIIHSQLELIKKDNMRFEGVIDVYTEKDWGPPVVLWMEEARHWQGVEDVTLSEAGLFEESMAILGESGNPEDIVWIDMVSCRKDFLDFYRLELIDSVQTARLLPATAYPVVVNETFVKKFVPDGINSIGEPVSKYLPDEPLFKDRTIVGVVRDFRKRSLSESVWPLFIRLSGSFEASETEVGGSLSEPGICVSGYRGYIGRSQSGCRDVDRCIVFVCGNQPVTDIFRFVQPDTLYSPSAPTGNRLAEDTWSFFWAHTVDIVPFVCSGVGNSFSDSCAFGICLHDAVAGAFPLLCSHLHFTFSDTVGNYSWNHFPYRMAKRL